MSYTSFSQKPHFLSRNGICCFCVERSCFILPTCLFSFLAWLEPPMFSRRKRNSCRRIWASKKDKEKHWPLFCAIALFSLPVCMSHSRAEACVCTSSVAVWDFLTCLQFFLHTLFFFPINRKTERNEWLSLVGSPKLTSTCSHAAWKSGTFDSLHAICGRKWCMYIHELYINCLAPSYFFEWYWSDIDSHYEVALSSAITAIHTKVLLCLEVYLNLHWLAH